MGEVRGERDNLVSADRGFEHGEFAREFVVAAMTAGERQSRPVEPLKGIPGCINELANADPLPLWGGEIEVPVIAGFLVFDLETDDPAFRTDARVDDPAVLRQ